MSSPIRHGGGVAMVGEEGGKGKGCRGGDDGTVANEEGGIGDAIAYEEGD